MAVDNLVVGVLACFSVLRVTTKKGRRFFPGGEKSTPPRENPGYAYAFYLAICRHPSVTVVCL